MKTIPYTEQIEMEITRLTGTATRAAEKAAAAVRRHLGTRTAAARRTAKLSYCATLADEMHKRQPQIDRLKRKLAQVKRHNHGAVEGGAA